MGKSQDWYEHREEAKALWDDAIALLMEILLPVLTRIINRLEKGISWLKYQVEKKMVVTEALRETIFATLDEDEEWDDDE